MRGQSEPGMISFFESSAKAPKFNRTDFRQVIMSLVADKKKIIGNISYIFCTDEKLLQINKKYLQHDTYTDVITFDYVEDDIVSGDIFISVERVHENAHTFNVTIKEELLRVMIHGVLHLLGLKDKTQQERERMRAAENRAMQRLTEYAKNHNRQ
jgi:rRNA maturation RNase YbeY